MKKNKFLAVSVLSLIALSLSACSGNSSSAPDTATVASANKTNSANAVAPPSNAAVNNTSHDTSSADEAPEAVKAVFAGAQSFTTQHKDVPENAIRSIEKETGGKIPGKDHHSYLAFAVNGGKRTQLGAATVVKAGGKDVIIVYESKDGMPTIREVRAEAVSAEFLQQFVGKNHDTRIVFGENIKAKGDVDEAAAKSISQAVRIDVLTMEALYGAPHTH